MRTAGIFGRANHYPLIILMLQMISKSHRHPAGLALGCDRDGGIGLVAVKLDIVDFDVHSPHVVITFGEVIDHALTHRVGVVLTALTGGKTKNQKHEGEKTHDPIIPECYIVPRAMDEAKTEPRADVCSRCFQPVPPKAARCPRCGEPMRKPPNIRLLLAVFGLLMFVAIAVFAVTLMRRSGPPRTTGDQTTEQPDTQPELKPALGQ